MQWLLTCVDGPRDLAAPATHRGVSGVYIPRLDSELTVVLGISTGYFP
ncbi:hypothetical protein C499_03018 [Halogeometricum borinquense DSM 11551]|uniref:Uncharacterized protein n=1 Tax=Halogeometricum borinquense (strain ATCC 700274 / DSM 11551 / JCM 10706 / KCTC 4070 / PR3) TaxID=469382 RepID=E4NQK6_HALBP|nr:hypothetical protein Hbor_11040 [Halogeometricum borinquense DSM 11551]ELY30203.1 hypothetical protein C499_03018 [Halogeometricum borinquense DSM 11551]